MNRRTLLNLAAHGLTLAPAAALFTVACAPASPPKPTSGGSPVVPVAGASAQTALGSGGTLTIAMSAGNLPYPNTPPNEGAEGSRFVGLNIYDALTRLNVEQGETTPAPKPNLAESWRVADDQLTWTFKLRPGVTFHDGTAFDANAVVFQFDRLHRKDFAFFDSLEAAASVSNFLSIDTYRAVDPLTLEIKTKTPYAFLPWDLLSVYMASPAVVKTYGVRDYQKHATGTGPFKMTKYVDGQVMELAPNPNYWRGKPKLDKIVLRPMPDPAARLAALQAGDVDWAEVPPPDSVKQLKAQGDQVFLKEYPHSIVLTLNLSKPALQNLKVRQALQYAIDRERMCTNLLDSVATPAYQYLYKGHPWYDPAVGDRYVYNPARAKQLLSEAGFAKGLKLTICYPTGGSGNMWPGPMMELIQANYKDVGINLTMVPLEWNDILSIYRAGLSANPKYDAMYFSPNTSAPPFLLSFASYRIPPSGCCNVTGYKSDAVDRLFQQAQREFDPKKQDDLLRQVMGLVAQDSPVVFVVHDLNLRVLSPRVQGFIQPMSWYVDFLNVWMRK